MLVRRLISALAACFLALSAGAQPSVLRIDDQDAFDSLGTAIRSFLEGDAPELDIVLGPGPFYFRDGHVRLDSIDAPGKKIRLRGDGTRILPALVRAPLDPAACRFEEGTDGPEPLSEVREMKRTRSLILVTDRKNRICRIRTDAVQDTSLVRDGYIYLTQWFKGATYKITAVKGRHIYFRADDLRQVRILFSVNLDWTFAMHYPRYSVLEGRGKTWTNADATTFLSLDGARFDGLSLSGLTFVGNRQEPGRSLFRVENGSAPLSLSGCRFERIQSDCISVDDSDDVVVEECDFTGCSRVCIAVEPGSSRIGILRNRIHESGVAGENSACISCYASDFQIRDNVISDYGYAAVRTGIHYSIEKKAPLYGVIAGNEIFQTPAYFSSAPDRLLMDSGAIYLTTQIDSLRIEGNHIHDINGPVYNRGIFADDGASNLVIVGNTISNIRSYYALDIDPRSSWKMLHRRKRRVDVANENVVIRDNVIDGKVRIAKMRKRTRRLGN